MEHLINGKKKVTVEEMKEYYEANYPFLANNRRIGKLAKERGYTLKKQMIKGKIYSFYYYENGSENMDQNAKLE